MEKQYTYNEPTAQEGEAINNDLKALIEKHSCVLVAVPVINYQKGNVLDAQINIMKKVELVPKAEGVPSPFIVNGENASAKTENEAETPEAN